MASSGARANKRGKMLEGNVREVLSENYQMVTPQRFLALREQLEQPIFSEQVTVGDNIYKKRRRVDFILYHPERWPDCLVIQCKWQTSQGSVEEKLPFEVECIKKDPYKTIIVLEGGGYSEGARQWLLEQCDETKLLKVCSLGDFARMQTRGDI